MGTRNLTCVFADGEYRIAQYGQWDGYPEGQGVTALEFLRDADLAVFKAKCLACRWITKEENDAQWAEAGHDGSEWVNLDVSSKHKRLFPQNSRDAGAKILQLVIDGAPGMAIDDSRSFASDSLFCEWAYVVDLDAGTFEVYKGFNRAPVPTGERFADFPREKPDSEYYPVRLVKKFALNDLPSKDEFVRVCSPADEDDE